MTTLQQLTSLFSKLWLLFMVICYETSSQHVLRQLYHTCVARRAISLNSPKPACCINSHPCLAPCLLPLSRNFFPDTPEPKTWLFLPKQFWETHHLMLPQRAQCLSITTSPPHVELLLTCELDCKDLAHCFPKLYL